MVFAVPDISDVLEWKKSVQKAFKKHSKSVEKALKKRSKPFGSVLEFKKSSGVEITVQEFFFVLNLAKLIDFVFGVEISTIKRIQVYIIHIYLFIYLITLCYINIFMYNLYMRMCFMCSFYFWFVALAGMEFGAQTGMFT